MFATAKRQTWLGVIISIVHEGAVALEHFSLRLNREGIPESAWF
jgi:hypothetical protein